MSMLTHACPHKPGWQPMFFLELDVSDLVIYLQAENGAWPYMTPNVLTETRGVFHNTV